MLHEGVFARHLPSTDGGARVRSSDERTAGRSLRTVETDRAPSDGRQARLPMTDMALSNTTAAPGASNLEASLAAEASKHYLHQEFEALMREPATLRFLDAGALDGLWYWDLENPEHEWMSPGFWRALGFDPAKRAHRAEEWQDLIFPEDRDRALENFYAHCADPDHPYDQIVRYVSADGGTVTVRCRGIAIRVNGVPKRMLGAHTVISNTSQRELTEKLNELLELSDDAVLAWTTDAGIKRWNRGAERLYGFTATEAFGATPDRLLAPQVDGGWDAVNAALERGKTWSGEVEWRARDGGKVYTSTSLQRIALMGESTLVLQIDRDISERLRAQREQALLVRELNHRVKNLFAVVQSLVKLSARFDGVASDFAHKLLQRLNALSQAQNISLGDGAGVGAQLPDMLDAIVAPYAPSSAALTQDGGRVWVEQQALTSLGLVLNELATNAVKHGVWQYPSGTISVAWRTDGDVVTLTWLERGHDGVVEPAQNGFGSTLIGLSVSQLGGTIEHEWNDGGLAVTLTFPHTDDPAATGAPE